MGEVYAARHLLLGEPVAIKFLKVNEVAWSEAVERLVREARAAMRLRGEHVVRVHDVAVDDDGAPYLVMEYLQGFDLAERLEESGPFEVQQAVDYLLEACKGVAEAHRMGIVHRDLKPANLYLACGTGSPPSAPLIKVLDFGIAKDTRLTPKTIDPSALPDPDASGGLTLSRGPLGSPYYMSPEQMEAACEVDARADIWALGVTLFELVTGNRPFGGSSIVQVYTQMIARGRAPWRRDLAGLQPGLESVIAKCLQRSPDDRFPSARELARALAPYGSGRVHESASRVPVPRAPRRDDTPTFMATTLRSERPGFELSQPRDVRAIATLGPLARRAPVPILIGSLALAVAWGTWPPMGDGHPDGSRGAATSSPSIDEVARVARGRSEPVPSSAAVELALMPASEPPKSAPADPPAVSSGPDALLQPTPLHGPGSSRLASAPAAPRPRADPADAQSWIPPLARAVPPAAAPASSAIEAAQTAPSLPDLDEMLRSRE
jgi:serine/threonine-protein kinase